MEVLELVHGIFTIGKTFLTQDARNINCTGKYKHDI